MQKDTCRFVIREKRCPNNRESLSRYCSEHKEYFAKIKNETLLEMTARSVKECIYVTEDKLIGARTDIECWGNFTNCMNELLSRGYKYEEAQIAIAGMLEKLGIIDELHKKTGSDPKWKKFEKIVTEIHMLNAEGAIVKFNDHIVGKRTGSKRQIDISLRFKHGFYEYLIIVECKDYKARIPIDIIEAFRTKIEDVGAHKGIMVSPKGFQEGAIETAKAHNIELFTLTEEMSDWTRKIREHVIKVPFPTKIEFDYVRPNIQTEPASYNLSFQDIIFYEDRNTPPITLAEIIRDACTWVHENNIALPLVVDLRLEKELLTKFPGDDFYTPVYGMKIRLDRFEFRSSRTIDIPPRVEKYVYKDSAGQSQYEVPVEKLPIGIDTVLEPGKFYTNRLGMKYRCISIDGNTAKMMLLDSKQHGDTIDVEFTMSISNSCNFMPLQNNKEAERLEKRYQLLKGQQREAKN